MKDKDFPEEEDDPLVLAKAFVDIVNPALADIRTAFIEVLNEGRDISVLQEAIKKLDDFRQFVNSAGNLGMVVGVVLQVVFVPLTGDSKDDGSQKRIDLTDPDLED